MKKIISLLLTLVMLFSLSTVAFAADDGYFYDISKSKNEAAIEYLYDLGIIEGYGNHKFGPNDTLTRAQACAIIVRAMLTDEEIYRDYNDTFVDVDWNSWYRSYVDSAYRHSYMHGYGKGYFGPTDQVTYAQFATIITNVLGYDATKIGGTWPANVFTIADKIGLFKNVTKQALASDPITREDAAQMIYNALDCNLVTFVDGKLVETTGTLRAVVDSDYEYVTVGKIVHIEQYPSRLNRSIAHFWMVVENEMVEIYGACDVEIHENDIVKIVRNHNDDVVNVDIIDCVEWTDYITMVDWKYYHFTNECETIPADKRDEVVMYIPTVHTTQTECPYCFPQN